jgi:hypothetical protein
MAKRGVTPKKERKHTLLNHDEATTLYANGCEVTVMAGDIRLSFREVIDASEDEVRVRDLVRIFVNVSAAVQLARILNEAIPRALSERPSATAETAGRKATA